MRDRDGYAIERYAIENCSAMFENRHKKPFDLIDLIEKFSTLPKKHKQYPQALHSTRPGRHSVHVRKRV